jgi:hypothetical protein
MQSSEIEAVAFYAGDYFCCLYTEPWPATSLDICKAVGLPR